MTNKQVFQEGNIIEHYPIDHNPFTGEKDSYGGFENLIIYGNKVYSVLTDFTGSIAYSEEEPDIISDDADEFVKMLFTSVDPDEVARLEAEEQEKRDDDELGMLYYWEESRIKDDWQDDRW